MRGSEQLFNKVMVENGYPIIPLNYVVVYFQPSYWPSRFVTFYGGFWVRWFEYSIKCCQVIDHSKFLCNPLVSIGFKSVKFHYTMWCYDHSVCFCKNLYYCNITFVKTFNTLLLCNFWHQHFYKKVSGRRKSKYFDNNYCIFTILKTKITYLLYNIYYNVALCSEKNCLGSCVVVSKHIHHFVVIHIL